MRPGRLSSTATVLFTDLVGSTALMAQLGDKAFDRVRDDHFARLRQAMAPFGAEEVKNTGDGLLTAFGSTVEALGAAVAAQQATDRHARSSQLPLAIRIGLSVGEVSFQDGDAFGTPVVEAARLVAIATGGQILASTLVRLVAGSRAEVQFRDLGPLVLKGLAEPVPVCEVPWEPMYATAVPLPAFLSGSERHFVGRDRELDSLRRAWEGVLDGQRQVVLVAGEPGVGKTRLAYEFAKLVHGQGALVLLGRCDEDLGVPYQPFVEALRHFVANVSRSDVAARLGELGPDLTRLVPEVTDRVAARPGPSFDPETERYRLFEAVALWFRSLSEDEPVLLVVDDLQWAAKPTLLLLRHLVRSALDSRLLILATYRDTEPAIALDEVLCDLRRDRDIVHLAVSGLDMVAVGQFVSAAIADLGVGDGLAPLIRSETAGNPFFISELLLHLSESGRLPQLRGTPGPVHTLDQLGIPDGVRDVVKRRLSRLSTAANRTLQVAAVVGAEFDFSLVHLVTALDRQEVVEALEEALSARLISEIQDSSSAAYAFTHALVRQTLVAELSRARKEGIHLRVADALEAGQEAAPTTRTAALALHYRLAGSVASPEKAIHYSLEAAKEASGVLAWEEAARHLEAALELMEATGDDRQRRADLLRRLADLMHVSGCERMKRVSYAEKALAIYEELGRDDRVAEMHSRLGAYLSVYLEDMDLPRALRHLEQARRLLEGAPDGPAVGYVHITLASAKTWALRPHEAITSARAGIATARRHGVPAMEALGTTIHAWALFNRGSLAEGLGQLEEGWSMADRLDHRYVAFLATWIRTFYNQVTLDHRHAPAWFDRELAKPRLAHAPGQRQILLCNYSWACIDAGDLDAARRMVTEAGDVPLAWSHAPPLEIWQGDWDSATLRLEQRRDAFRVSGNRIDEWAFQRLLAVLARLRSNHEDAAAILEGALALALDGEHHPFEVVTRLDLALLAAERHRHLDAERQLERCRELTAGEDWRGLRGRVEHAEAALLVAQQNLGDAEKHLQVARAIFNEFDLPWEEAEVLRTWGKALRREDSARADELLADAAALYRRCGASRRWFERIG